MKRFNGWQRLWVALSGVWLLTVASFTVALMPKASDYASIGLYQSVDAVGHHLERDNPSYRYEGASAARSKYADLSDDEVLAKLHEKYKGKVDFQAVETEYHRKIDRLAAERAKMVGTAFLAWLIPAAAVYGLGLTVGWILHGFRQPNP